MKVVEIFSSIDGEGKRTGQIATFVRLAGCNLRCSYCDTKYSFDEDSCQDMSIDEIVTTCKNLGYHNITLTGGEPLLHTNEALMLIEALCDSEFQVNIETNGSIDLRPFVRLRQEKSLDFFFTVDYKCLSSGMNKAMNLWSFNCLDVTKDIVKCVVSNTVDMDNALIYLDKINRPFNIWFSPVFGAIEPKDIVDYVLKTGREDITVQVQLHKIIWDPNKRGV